MKESPSSYVFPLDNGTIKWSSKKQTCIDLSTMEAEFIAYSTTVQKVVCLKRFMEHLGIHWNAIFL